MLTDPVEIRIISKARQANVRDPRRSRDHFVRIFDDFLTEIDFDGARILDLGPGQYDFAVLAGQRGAEVWGIDNDPAVIELGRYKRLPVVEGDIKRLTPDMFSHRFDGLFCKFSINAFWFGADVERLRAHVANLCSALDEDGWAWIAPWNGAPRDHPLTPEQVQAVLAAQRDAFAAHGFERRELTESRARHYGIHGEVVDSSLFLRGLQPGSPERRGLARRGVVPPP